MFDTDVFWMVSPYTIPALFISIVTSPTFSRTSSAWAKNSYNLDKKSSGVFKVDNVKNITIIERISEIKVDVFF